MACSLAPPSDDLTPRLAPQHAAAAPSRAAAAAYSTVATFNHSHAWLFSPVSRGNVRWSADALYAAFHDNQHPEDCRRARYLFVENDLPGSGLGMLSKLLIAALRLAARDGRVMVEVPHRNRSGIIQQLWCDRPPHTLSCVFEPWSHCQATSDRSTARSTARPHLIRRPDRFEWPLKARKVRIPLTYVLFWGGLWMGQSSWMDVQLQRLLLARVLFRPRQWVRAIGDCVLTTHHLQQPKRLATIFPFVASVTSPFTALFVRDSPEKRKELGGHPTPPLHIYSRLALALGRSLGAPRLFLQTSSPNALSYFQSFAANASLPLAYTEHAREERDGWGKATEPALAMEHATIAAVNLHVASKAVAFVSLAHSMWTTIQLASLSAGAADGRSNGDGGGGGGEGGGGGGVDDSSGGESGSQEGSLISPLSWIQVRCKGSPLDIRIATRRSLHGTGPGVEHLKALIAQEEALKCRVMGFKEEGS